MRRPADASQIVSSFYEAAANPLMWTQALDAVTAMFNLRGTLLPTDRFVKGMLPHSSGMQDVLAHFFEERWHEQDLRTQAALPYRGYQGFMADQHLLSLKDIKGSDYYMGFARKAGVPWFAAAVLNDEPGEGYIALSLQRTERQGSFRNSELVAMERLLPQLRNSVVLAKSLAGMHGRSLLEGLQMSGQPAILVAPSGKVVAVNDAAAGVLGSGITIAGGQLRAARPKDDTELRLQLDRACREAPLIDARQPCAPVVIRTGQRQILVRIAPIRRTGTDLFAFAGAIVMLTEISVRHAIPADLLRQVFGLTPREAAIAAAVCAGSSVSEIAGTFGISREAVRFHLKAIFAKTETHRQSELVALCLQVV